MSEDYQAYQAQSSTSDVSLPVLLLTLTVAVFLGAQLGAASGGGKLMQWQLKNLDQQIENVKAGKEQLGKLYKERDELVKQSGQVQAQYTALLNDVVELAKDDEDAKKVVAKWNIQRNAPPAKEGSSESKPAEEKDKK